MLTLYESERPLVSSLYSSGYVTANSVTIIRQRNGTVTWPFLNCYSVKIFDCKPHSRKAFAISSQSLIVSVEWLRKALAKSKLDNEQFETPLADRDKQNHRLKSALADSEDRRR